MKRIISIFALVVFCILLGLRVSADRARRVSLVGQSEYDIRGGIYD